MSTMDGFRIRTINCRDVTAWSTVFVFFFFFFEGWDIDKIIFSGSGGRIDLFVEEKLLLWGEMCLDFLLHSERYGNILNKINKQNL